MSQFRNRKITDLAADNGGRALEIDAIRGWASLSVATYHVLWETFGLVVPWLKNPYTSGLISGRFDVIMFFILSGDALSYPFFHGGGLRYLQRAALKRYLRLTIPIVAVTTVITLAMMAGLTFNKEAAVRVNAVWLGGFALFDPTIQSALEFSLSKGYFGGGQPYLPVLWTMMVEFTGSYILILALLMGFASRHASYLFFLAGLLMIGLDSYVGCFFLGIVLGKARHDGLFRSLPRLFGYAVAPFGMISALVLVGHLQMIPSFELTYHAFAGFMFLFCAYACRPFLKVLRASRFSLFLGRISFLLYLWHYVVIVTVTSWAIIALSNNGLLNQGTALVLGLSTILFSVGLSWITLPIETWAHRANSVLLRLVLRQDTIRSTDASMERDGSTLPSPSAR